MVVTVFLAALRYMGRLSLFAGLMALGMDLSSRENEIDGEITE
jgi:hypothetical protein